MPPAHRLAARLTLIALASSGLLLFGACGDRRSVAAPAVGPAVLSPAAESAVIEWRRPGVGAERVSLGRGGMWLGPAAGPRTHLLFPRRELADDLGQFARTWASFQQTDPAHGGTLLFQGQGSRPASVAERRMITEWTRLVSIEASGDGSPVPYGLALAWHRAAATGGACDELTVYLGGEIHAGPCGVAPAARGRLSGDNLERLYAWVDDLAAFQSAGGPGVQADALLDRLTFAGQGRRAATPADIAAIESFASALHHDLTAKPAAAAPPPDAPDSKAPAADAADFDTSF